MTKIYIVRHGQAASGWSDKDMDPPLSKKGEKQAMAASQQLLEFIGEKHIQDIQCISSPIKRAHQTAKIFADQHNLEIRIAKPVAEIPSAGLDMDERLPWLMSIMKDTWPSLSPELNQWRKNCINFVEGLEQDSVIFSHYIAINVLIGYCHRDDRVTSYNPDNCSIHTFELDPDTQHSAHLQIVELGKEADTKIN